MSDMGQELEMRASATAPAEREWQPTNTELLAIHIEARDETIAALDGVRLRRSKLVRDLELATAAGDRWQAYVYQNHLTEIDERIADALGYIERREADIWDLTR